MKQTGLGLHVTKNFNSKSYQITKYIKFAVVDLNNPKGYPLNFVCVLPRNINPKTKTQSKFQEKFGGESHDTAKELLNTAILTEDDQDIKKAIIERLKLIDPKPKNLAKCNRCGKDFEYRKYNYGRQKTCSECRNKKRTDQE